MRKRILSLVLVGAFAMSLFVVGASAATFTDDKDIVNKDAVQRMVSLNILSGKEAGNFDPKGIVTRAELCKMIYIAMNGGNDSKYNGVTATSFQDIKGHWAESYINYCLNKGIVSGMGDKSFAPNQGVTMVQACKMLLIALGYDAGAEKLSGEAWEKNTERLAEGKHLYQGLGEFAPQKPLNRDAAAQMISNFCDAKLVTYEFQIVGSGSDVISWKQDIDMSDTVVSKYYKLQSIIGTLDKITYDSSKKQYGYQIGATTYYTEDDYAHLFGMKVKLFYIDKANNGAFDGTDDLVIDIIDEFSSILSSGYIGDFSSSGNVSNQELTFKGEKYQMDAATIPSIYYVDGSPGPAYAGDASVLVPSGYECAKILLLDLDNNITVDKIVIAPFNLEEVTEITSDRVTVTGMAASKKLADLTICNSEIMKKNAPVCVYDAKYSATGKVTLEGVIVNWGKVSEIKDGQFKVGRLWYTNHSGVKIKLNDQIDFVALGGVIYYVKVSDRIE